jgi:NAD(P) transhydrogenase subunit beta
MAILIDFSVIVILITGIWQFRRPRGARIGNLLAAFALSAAFVLVLYRNGVSDVGTVIGALLAGAIAGYAVARAVSMIQIPSMVAFQHGAGGVAAFLVSFVELTRNADTLDRVSEISGVLGLSIGSLTFSGSIIASAKLANKMRQTPQVWPAHQALLLLNIGALLSVGIVGFNMAAEIARYLYLFQIVLAISFGILFSVRIGGADMPVLISFLNATAGLAAAFCGMVIGNQLLIAFGATVAASGSILTHVMCKAMNRNIARVIWPSLKNQTAATKKNATPGALATRSPAEDTAAATITDNFSAAVDIIQQAQTVIIIPGYGMALAKAQQEVAALAKKMVSMQKEVKYAIHPVAGRMPGHMNVLLAEAGVDYDMLVEMEEINSDFSATDLALVIGACDVVNPAAIDIEGTPISGMPILTAHESRHVICCNFDKKPGYSGVENSLYQKTNTIMLLGDASQTVHRLWVALTNGKPDSKPAAESSVNPADKAAGVLAEARRIIIIPGYGMALAKAQFQVCELARRLNTDGRHVKFAIHPVAGRMPGHMNVILAEAEVDYDDLLEMDEVNPLFSETDAVLIVGACDVVNPAAIEKEGTPISGMPILMAHQAKKIIVCNFDKNPGYSGVPNSLYENEKTILLLGDAKESTANLISSLKSLGA